MVPSPKTREQQAETIRILTADVARLKRELDERASRYRAANTSLATEVAALIKTRFFEEVDLFGESNPKHEAGS